jgi:hypothetical protein
MKLRYFLFLLTLLLVGCPEDNLGLSGVRPASGSRTPAPSDPEGGVEKSNPTTTPSPTPSSQTLASVKAVRVDKLSVTLYPLPVESSHGLGLPTQTPLSAYSELNDGRQGEAAWCDRSAGVLNVSASGQVSVKPSTLPGTYFVRAHAVDDPNVYQDVAVIVASHGDLELEIR